MDYTQIFVIISMTAAVSYAYPELTISPPGSVQQGETLVITCTVNQDRRPLDVTRISRQIDGRDHEIVSNDILKDHFTNTGRYEVTKWDPKTGTVQLTITNIKGADGGNIGCKLLPSEDGAYEDVIVKVPVKSVEMLYVDDDDQLAKATDGQTVKMRKGLPSGVVCKVTVEGSDFKPDIKVFLDEEDVTSMFKQNETMLKESQHGMLKYHYSADLEWRPKAPELKYNGKTLKCEAKMPEFDAQSASVNMEVLYPPELHCNEQMYAKAGEDFRMYCVATMHPAPNDVSVIWSWDEGEERRILNSGQKEGRLEAKTAAIEDSKYEISLELSKVEASDYKSYKLEISNGVGTAEKMVPLIEASEVTYKPVTPKPTPKPKKENQGNPDMNTIVGASASSISGTILVLLVAMLSAAILKL